jgi:hypothetical protein
VIVEFEHMAPTVVHAPAEPVECFSESHCRATSLGGAQLRRYGRT